MLSSSLFLSGSERLQRSPKTPRSGPKQPSDKDKSPPPKRSRKQADPKRGESSFLSVMSKCVQNTETFPALEHQYISEINYSLQWCRQKQIDSNQVPKRRNLQNQSQQEANNQQVPKARLPQGKVVMMHKPQRQPDVYTPPYILMMKRLHWNQEIFHKSVTCVRMGKFSVFFLSWKDIWEAYTLNVRYTLESQEFCSANVKTANQGERIQANETDTITATDVAALCKIEHRWEGITSQNTPTHITTSQMSSSNIFLRGQVTCQCVISSLNVPFIVLNTSQILESLQH